MAFWKTIRLRYASRDHHRSLHVSRLSTRRGTERVENDTRYCGCCGLETPAYDGSANFDFYNLRGLKLKGQNLPKSASLRHSEKKFLWGTRKHKKQKSSKNQLIGPFLFFFKKTDWPGKEFISLKMHYFSRKTMTFSFFYHLCFPMKIPMSFQSFRKPVFKNHVARSTTRSIFGHPSLREASRKQEHNTAIKCITGKNVPHKVTAKMSSKKNA